jgi:hypothetical protein
VTTFNLALLAGALAALFGHNAEIGPVWLGLGVFGLTAVVLLTTRYWEWSRRAREQPEAKAKVRD